MELLSLEQADGSIPYSQLSIAKSPRCLILGNEINGVSEPVLEISDTILEIPMLGIKQSLNVATAGGICMYRLLEVAGN